MEGSLDVVIVKAICSKTHNGFGIRFEEKNKGCWVANWAFSLKDNSATVKPHEQAVTSGTFSLEAEYPGCPHCESPSIFKCGCEQVACWDGKTRQVTCPSCNHTGELVGELQSLRTVGDV